MLTKSELLSFRQCPRKLWLERQRSELLPEPDSTSDRRAIDGFKVGEKAREILGAEVLWPSGLKQTVTKGLEPGKLLTIKEAAD